MSYCRWSSMNFRCDVYAYASVHGGYMVHIAQYRAKPDVPKVPPLSKESLEDGSYMAAQKEQFAFLDSEDSREPIGLPLDGQTFNLPTAVEFKAKMQELRDMGYAFPDGVLEAIDEDIAEEAANDD